MAKQIQIYDVRKVKVIDVPDPKAPDKNEVVVETLYSGISAGTEMAFFQGTAPHFNKYMDPQTKLFIPTSKGEVKYPLSYGYENVGRIVAVGAGSQNLKVGDVVASYYGHISAFKSSVANTFTLLPKDMDPRCGVFMPLLGVAYKNILNAKIILGETVVIFGMGIVGQLILQLAKRSGAGTVIAVDMLERRLEKGLESGADIVLNPKKIKDIALKVRTLTSNRGADVVFEASGSTKALHEAIRTVYPSGPVYATSFYRGESKGLFLGDEFHHLNVRIVSSGGIPYDVRPRWDERRWQQMLQSTLPLLKLKHLISHEMPLTEVQRAYDLLDKSPQDTMQVIFSYQSR